MKNMMIPIELSDTYNMLNGEIAEHSFAKKFRNAKNGAIPFSKKFTHFPQRINKECKKAILRGDQLIASLRKLHLMPKILVDKEAENMIREIGLQRTDLITLGAENLGAINKEICDFIDIAACPVLILKCIPSAIRRDEDNVFLIDLK